MMYRFRSGKVKEIIGEVLERKLSDKQYHADSTSALTKEVSDEIKLLLISKSSIDASGKKTGSAFARAEKAMIDIGFSVYVLTRPKDGPLRTINWDDSNLDLKLTESGFIEF